jgi:rod shape-determining protein MreB
MLNRLFHLLAGADLAIDLGTANTLISAAGEGLLVNEPSVVAVENGTNRVLSGGAAVGHLAKQMLGRTPDSISAVRPLRAGVIADFTLCEAMLRYFLNKTRRRHLGVGPRVLVAVPGSITPVEKQAVYNTAHRAGARQVFLVHEARAAAIGVGLPVAEPLASMVCDIGGGTTEVAVLSLADIVASQSVRTGGDSMDQAIADYLLRHYSLSVGQATAERLRIDIGSAFPLDDELVDEVRGIDRASGLPRRATVTSEEIRLALADPLEQIVDAVKAVVDRTSPDLVADLVQQGMVLVGGGALVRGIDRFLAEQTGLPVRVAPDPQSAVAKGAQICLEHLADWRGTLEAGDDDV